MGRFALVAGILALALLVVYLTRREGPQPPLPGEPSARATEQAGETPPRPVLVRIRRTPERHLEVHWSFDPAFELIVSHFLVEELDGDGNTAVISPKLPASARSYLDERPKEDGQEVGYFVTLVDGAGREWYSDAFFGVYRVRPILPAPRRPSARWLRIDGGSRVELSWEPLDGYDGGYVVYADDRKSGAFEPRGSLDSPVRAPPFFCAVRNRDSRQVAFRISAIDEAGQEGTPAEVACRCPANEIPAPSSPAVSRADDDGAPIVVTWEYESGVALRAFRILEGGHVAGEVGPDVRRWEDVALIPDRAYAYEVEAVSEAGVASPRTTPVRYELRLRATEVAPSRRTGFGARWEVEGQGLAARLDWDPPGMGEAVAGYRLEHAAGAGGSFEPIAVEGRPHSFTVRGLDPGVAHRFRLFARDADARDGAAAEAALPAAQDSLPAPRLLDCQEVAGGRVRWVWTYPDLAVLGGFRLFHNKRQVAEVDRDARNWLSDPLPAGRHEFGIEAVVRGGPPSARGPAQVYDRKEED